MPDCRALDLKMKRSGLIGCCLGLAVAASAYPLTAAAGPASDLEKARRERVEIQRRLDRTVADYHAAEARLATTQEQIAAARRRLSDAEKRLAQARLAINQRARAMYRVGPIGLFQALIEAEGIRDFVRRLELLERASGSDTAVIIRAQRARAEIAELSADLEVRLKREKETTARLRALTRDFESLFRDAASKESVLLAERDAEIRRRQEQDRRARLAAAVALRARFNPGNFLCPVDGPTSFTDSWGDPRPGGRRHEGVDLFAARGTPVAAVVDGILKMHRSSAGGISLYLTGGDGTDYFYAHLDRYASVSSGQRVPRGTHVAYVGNTGNARGGAPHLHFEIHPGGGSAINPYPTVRAACG